MRDFLISFESVAQVAVITPTADLRGIPDQQFEAALMSLLKQLDEEQLNCYVVDFQGRGYFSSDTLLSLLGALWHRARGGRHDAILLCHPSDREHDILARTRLNTIWPVYASRSEAFAALHGGPNNVTSRVTWASHSVRSSTSAASCREVESMETA
jgi:hypothetical protein